jgi:hypothetical protein
MTSTPLIILLAVTVPRQQAVLLCQHRTNYYCFTTIIWASSVLENAMLNFSPGSEKTISQWDGDPNIHGLPNNLAKLGTS